MTLQGVEDVAGAVDIDPGCHVMCHREVVDGSEVPGLGDAVEHSRVEAQAGLGDVTLHQLDPALQRRVVGAEFVDTTLCARCELRLNETHGVAVGAPQNARQQRTAEEAWEPGHESGHRLTPCSLHCDTRMGQGTR